MAERIVRVPEAETMIGVKRSTLWRLSRDPDSGFPGPILIGKRSIGWLESSLDAYLASRPSAKTARKVAATSGAESGPAAMSAKGE